MKTDLLRGKVVAMALMGVVAAVNSAVAATYVAGEVTWTYDLAGSSKTDVCLVGGPYGQACREPKPAGDFALPGAIKNGTLKIVRINDGAFANCSGLTSLSLPDSVSTIYDTFSGCTGLTNVTFASGALKFGDASFAGCSNLVSFASTSANYSCPGGLLCNAAQTELFRCPPGLKSVSVPSSVSSITKYAFANCALESIHLPESLSYLSTVAFRNVFRLSSFSISEANAYFSCIDGVLYDKTVKTLVSCPASRTSFAIPNGVTNIEEYAFVNCSNLRSVSFPETLSRISAESFNGLAVLETATFHGNVPENFAKFASNVFPSCPKIRYPRAYAANWEALGLANGEVISPTGTAIIVK